MSGDEFGQPEDQNHEAEMLDFESFAMSEADNPSEIIAGEESDSMKSAIESVFGQGAFDLIQEDEPPTEDQLDGLSAVEREMLQFDSELGLTASLAELAENADQQQVDLGEKHIVFTLGETRIAIAINRVVEIQQSPAATWIPNVPDWIVGVCNLRGDILSLTDFRKLIGLPPSDGLRKQRMVVIRSSDEQTCTGLLVDSVHGIRSFPLEAIRNTTIGIEERLVPFIEGIARSDGDLLAVLQADRLFDTTPSERNDILEVTTS